jgi:hypothetical protein
MRREKRSGSGAWSETGREVGRRGAVGWEERRSRRRTKRGTGRRMGGNGRERRRGDAIAGGSGVEWRRRSRDGSTELEKREEARAVLGSVDVGGVKWAVSNFGLFFLVYDGPKLGC